MDNNTEEKNHSDVIRLRVETDNLEKRLEILATHIEGLNVKIDMLGLKMQEVQMQMKFWGGIIAAVLFLVTQGEKLLALFH